MPQSKSIKTRRQRRTKPKRSSFAVKLWWRRGVALAKAALLLIVVGGFGAIWHLGAGDQMLNWGVRQVDRSIVYAGLVVKDISIEGADHTSRADILRALAIKKGDSTFSYAPNTAKARLEKLPWIQHAAVYRQFTGGVHIKLVERQPIAIWQNSSKLCLIDKTGDVISGQNLKQFSKLLLVVGDGAPKNVADLAAELEHFPTIRKQVTAAVYVSGRRWDLVLNDKLRVKLPETDLRQALINLVQLDQQQQISGGRVLTIDLRMPNRSFLYLPAGKLSRKSRARGKHT